MKQKKTSPGRHPSLRRWLSYHFDNLMARGMVAKILVLLIFTLCCILAFGLIVTLATSEHGIRGSIWQSFLHAIDPGTIGGDEGNLAYLFFMTVITLFGLLFTGTLIGILNNGVEKKMDDLSKGRSQVLEKDHTVVLGYNDVTLAILRELVEANRNQGKVPVVVMDDTDVTDMEDAVINRVGLDRHTRFIFRRGSTCSFDDLEMCSLHTCRSVIINLSDDFDTIKAILACSGKLDEIQKEGIDRSDVYVTAVIQDEANEAQARLAGGKRLRLVVYPRFMSKIIAGACRQTGLSYVYTELFNYADNEIYCVEIPSTGSLRGSTPVFSINQHLRDSIAIGGIPLEDFRTDRKSAYRVHNESMVPSYTFPALPAGVTFGDFRKFFVLEEDDDPIRPLSEEESGHQVRTWLLNPHGQAEPEQVKILILGISPFISQILYELDGYFAGMGMQVEIVLADDGVIDEAMLHRKKETFEAIWIHPVQNVDVYNYDVLENLAEPDITSILLLTEDLEDRTREDELVLTQLIFLREISRVKNLDFNITCEMNLDENRQLAALTGHNDYVVGSSVTALIMTQISQYHELYDMFQELLSNSGSEIYMKRADAYLTFTAPTMLTDFYTLTEAAGRRGEILIGLQRLKDRDPSCRRHEYEEPVLNPPKWKDTLTGPSELVEYELLPGDLLVIIAR